MTQTVKITDRNEAKFLFAMGFEGTPSARNANQVDFEFTVSKELHEARRGFTLNHPCPILSFIAASRHIDKAILEHRSTAQARL